MVERYKINKKNFIIFFNFITLGALAGFLNFFSRIILSLVFNFHISVLVAQIFGMFVAFFLFRNYVFKAEKRSSQWVRFLMVNIISLIIVLIVSHIFAYFLLPSIGIHRFKYEIAHLIGIGSTVITSFLLHKFWTYS